MLRLEKIEILGFKSFGDATQAVFQPGITAIVGPNGCGKSNIGDAINWVLGEQSARMLRGSSMQDVIFNGSEVRRPVGLAEVTLHLGAPGPEPGSTKRVTITRRLFRDGESEYLLDGARSRLRDIQDLLREERVGVRTYATIEQGRIDQILNAKPKDRRLIIEEAAGIAGFKHKRRLAELKLEATQANLLRVSDVLAEVRRQINSLKRQAARARRYTRLRDELRAKEAVRFDAKARALDLALQEARDVETKARDEDASHTAGLAASEASLVEDRLGLEETERRLRGLAEELHRLDIEIDRKQARIASCRERIATFELAERRMLAELEEIRGRRLGLEAEVAERSTALGGEESELSAVDGRLGFLVERAAEAAALEARHRDAVEGFRRALFDATGRVADQRNRRRAIEESLDRARALAERLIAEKGTVDAEAASKGDEAAALDDEARAHERSLEDLQVAAQRIEAELRDARARLAEDIDALGVVRQRERTHAAGLSTLEDVATRFAGASDGVRLLLGRGGAIGVGTLGVVADFVEATRDFEEAAEAYLNALLPAVVVRDDDDTARAASLLREEGAGRTLLLGSNHPSGALAVGVAANGRAPIPEELMRDSRVIGRLRDRIRLKSGDGFVSQRIGDAVLVDSLESALALHRAHPQADYLTPTGEVVYASGLVAAGGRHTGESGYLAHTRRIHEERLHLAEASSVAGDLEARVHSGRREQERLEVEVARARAELDEATRRRLDVQLRAQRTADERSRAVRRLEVLAQEIEAARGDVDRLLDERSRADADVADAEARFAETESALTARIADLDAAALAVRSIGEESASLRADAAARRQRVTASRAEIERVRGALQEIDRRAEALDAEIESGRARAREDAASAAQAETDLAVDIDVRQRTSADQAAVEQDVAQRRTGLQAAEEALRKLRSSLDERREALRAAEMTRLRAETDRSHLDDLCLQELGVVASDAARIAGEDYEDAAALDPADLEARIAELRTKIEGIGPVNLTAIEEFSSLEERETFLSTQKADLEEAMESLRESIRRINRSSRERFVEVFESVRASYQEVFKVLFNGGRADLVLEEGEDVLEAGIEMVAQPPGKRLGSVMLLSGGEKAMSAIALLFAIFRTHPSPFCLLDEVDAALDDVNVGRFTRMLREYAESTQFILITHNKRSMEAANSLYGVTMEEPGISRLVSIRL